LAKSVLVPVGDVVNMDEATRHQRGMGSVPNLSGKSGNRGNRELKRLVCSVN